MKCDSPMKPIEYPKTMPLPPYLVCYLSLKILLSPFRVFPDDYQIQIYIIS